jgi:hypothetical protein
VASQKSSKPIRNTHKGVAKRVKPLKAAGTKTKHQAYQTETGDARFRLRFVKPKGVREPKGRKTESNKTENLGMAQLNPHNPIENLPFSVCLLV